MNDFDLTAVSALSARYVAAGLATTWNCQFLVSIVKCGAAPRGRGVEILQKILMTSPETTKQEADDLRSLGVLSGIDSYWLNKSAANICNGWPLDEKALNRVAAIRTKVMSGDIRLPTAEEKELMRTLFRVKHSYSEFYWSRRGGTSDRLTTLFTHIGTDSMITDEDINWVRSQFKGVIKKLEQTEHPIGSLRTFVDHLAVKSIVMVVSSPRLGVGYTNTVVVDTICNGVSAEISVDRLAKRFGKFGKDA